MSAKCSGAGNASSGEGRSSIDSDVSCSAIPLAVCPFSRAVAEASLPASEGVALWSTEEDCIAVEAGLTGCAGAAVGRPDEEGRDAEDDDMGAAREEAG